MGGADLGEQCVEDAAAGVDLGVVGHYGVGWVEAELRVEAERADEAVVVGGRVFAAVDLGVGDT